MVLVEEASKFEFWDEGFDMCGDVWRCCGCHFWKRDCCFTWTKFQRRFDNEAEANNCEMLWFSELVLLVKRSS